MPSPENACVNCHFLVEMSPNSNLAGALGKEQRDAITRKEFQFLKEGKFLKCYLGVWNERNGLDTTPKDRYERLVTRDRAGECFYWGYVPGMEQEAARRLQKREEDREQFWERNKWVRRGAIAAIGAVIVSTLFQILDFLLQCTGLAIFQ